MLKSILSVVSVFIILILFATLSPFFIYAQSGSTEPGSLPTPMGAYAIGRVTIHFTDTMRTELLSTDGSHRELMVDIWYPTDTTAGSRAQYLNVEAFDQALDVNGLRDLLGDHVDKLLRTERVQTNAIDGAPFTRFLNRSPVLIFSHGMGTVSQIHTSQIEDLVSHGYVVAAITHTYDAWLTVLPDGRYIPFERFRRESAGGSEELNIAYEDTRVEWWAQDILFVLNELERQARTRSPAMPFAGYLDFDRVGAFGHSVGGRAAARACQLDSRLRACANQDGVAMMLPFYLDEYGWGMDQPFMLIVRERTSQPSDDELQSMGLTRSQANSLVEQLRARRDSTMARTGGGSYRVVLNFETTDHMSFSDLPLLQARDSTETAIRTRILNVLNTYTRAFFDQTLFAIKAPILNDGATGEFVDFIQKYPPALPRPNRPNEQ